MADPPTTEGQMTWPIAGVDAPCSTYYKIIGTISKTSKLPLIIAHGGPGCGHDYLLPIADQATKYSTPCIFYDQIGCGKSTHLPEKLDDESFWYTALFHEELDRLIEHLGITERGYHFYGHSWGAMLGATWCATRPRGLKSAILGSGPASIETWIESVGSLKLNLPLEMQKDIDRCEAEKDFENESYKKAMDEFAKRYIYKIECPEVDSAFAGMLAEDSPYRVMLGPSEMTVLGSLRNWTAVPGLKNINVPTLLIAGENDEAQPCCLEPFFWNIDKVKWVTLTDTTHFCYLEKRDEYHKLVADFIAGVNRSESR